MVPTCDATDPRHPCDCDSGASSHRVQSRACHGLETCRVRVGLSARFNARIGSALRGGVDGRLGLWLGLGSGLGLGLGLQSAPACAEGEGGRGHRLLLGHAARGAEERHRCAGLERCINDVRHTCGGRGRHEIAAECGECGAGMWHRSHTGYVVYVIDGVQRLCAISGCLLSRYLCTVEPDTDPVLCSSQPCSCVEGS